MLSSHLLALAVPPRASAWSAKEVVDAASGVTTGLVVAFFVSRRVRRMPWPQPSRARFVALHVATALAAIAAWAASASVIETLVLGGSVFGRVGERWDEFLFIGSLLYAIVAGVSHAVEASARAVRAEALAARTQLAALRAQLQPHFLFNALHTVVHLIPVEPARAMEAAEQVADLLRATLEEQRDEVALGEEWQFVSRYLAVERIRFGDRLGVRADVPAALLDARVPAFALQTLVENAVRHGAAPRVAATEIAVTAAATASALTLSVHNTGDGGSARAATNGRERGTPAGAGTGLARLRERLAVLYGGGARLACGPAADGGFEAVLVVPRHHGQAA